MNETIHDEIERLAHDLYEQSGREEGKDLINWLAAEKIVLSRFALSVTTAGEDPGLDRTPAQRRRGRNGRRRQSDT